MDNFEFLKEYQMAILFSIIGWAAWAFGAFMAVTFVIRIRKLARTGRTFSWPTAIWALFLWVIIIVFLLTPWSKLHILWLLPSAFLGSMILFLSGVPILTPVVLFLTGIFMRLIIIGVETPARKDDRYLGKAG